MKINGMVFLVRKWVLAFVQPLLQLHFFSGADSCKWQSAELKMHGCSSQDGGQEESTYLIFSGHDTIPLYNPQPTHHSHIVQIYVLTHSTMTTTGMYQFHTINTFQAVKFHQVCEFLVLLPEINYMLYHSKWKTFYSTKHAPVCSD